MPPRSPPARPGPLGPMTFGARADHSRSHVQVPAPQPGQGAGELPAVNSCQGQKMLPQVPSYPNLLLKHWSSSGGVLGACSTPARWSRGMILASGARGPGFNSRTSPPFGHPPSSAAACGPSARRDQCQRGGRAPVPTQRGWAGGLGWAHPCCQDGAIQKQRWR